MIREFAIDPEALDTWERFRYVIEKFGVEHGRVISHFPKAWQRLVYEAAKDCSDTDRKRIEIRLQELLRRRRRFLWSFSRHYDPDRTWIVNAVEQHGAQAFYSIICRTSVANCETVVAVADSTDESFAVERDLVVPRSASALAAAIGPLLAQSRELIFVDPHFNPSVARWRHTLAAFLIAATTGGQSITRCEYHLKQSDGLLSDFPAFEQECLGKLPMIVPQGLTLTLRRWKQMEDLSGRRGEKLHPRYILTDLGGVRVECGLDQGPDGETTDVSLLSDRIWALRRENYLGDPPAFSHADLDQWGNPRFVSIIGAARIGQQT